MARSLGFRATNADIRREAESLLREEDRMRGEERGEIPDSADSDGDYGGQITIDLALATRILLQLGHARRNGEEEMRAYFGTLDGGNKGFVTLEDLRRVRDEVGVAERELMDVVGSGSSDADFIGGVVGDAALRAMIEQFDVDCDGVVDYREFRNVLSPFLSPGPVEPSD
jgi:Ca2+-binding EF-hand superfamily protein